MTISAGLAAELAMLSRALDDAGDSIAQRMLRLADEISGSVESYLGLSVTIRSGDPPIMITMLQGGTLAASIHTSARIALPGAEPDSAGARPDIALILYAAAPGAFVDLAADLTWLTRGRGGEITLDQHLTVPAGLTGTLSAASTINQAIGVLIAGGNTPEQAHERLSEPADFGPVDRLSAATRILACLSPYRGPDPSPAAGGGG